ncbi:MAG: tetratricopeptide repeat protein [Bacteroidetes bacterium]|nr:tetratricopeptide repeat protein [Bacteroidota bacterium]
MHALLRNGPLAKGLLLAVGLLIGAAAFAQAGSAPSRKDLERVAELNRRSFDLRKDHPDSSMALAREAIILAGGIGDTVGLALAYKRVGLVMSRRSDLDSALWYYRKAMVLEERVGHRKGMMATAQNIGEVLKKKGDLDQARDMYLVALDLGKALEDDEAQALAHNALGATYQRMGDFDLALDHLFKALEIRKRTKDKVGLRASYLNLGNLYFAFDRDAKAQEYYHYYIEAARQEGSSADMATGLMSLGNMLERKAPMQALAYYDSALVRYRQVQNKVGEANTLLNMAGLRTTQRDHATAMLEAEAALDLHEKAGNSRGIGQAHLLLGKLERLQGDLPAAEAHLQKALHEFNDSGNKAEVPNVIDQLSLLRQAQGRLDEALELIKRYQEMKDSLFGEKQTEQLAVAEMREKYDAEQRVAEIQELKAAKALEVEKQERRTWERNALIGILLLLVLALSMLMRDLRQRKRLARQEHALYEQRINGMMRQQEIRSLDAMMEGQEKERKRIAQDLHDRLGSMLSAIKLQFSALEGRIEALQQDHRKQYAHVFSLLDEAVGEVRRISHDMVSSSLARFGLRGALEDLRAALEAPGKLKVEMSLFGLDERLDQRVEIATYRMVQECVANALKHAKAGQISIQATRSAGTLNVIVEDDGVGFDTKDVSEGMGMGNLRQRAAAIGGTVQVDARPGRGTSVTIDIPLA